MISQGPLCDVRVLAVEQYGAGPFGTQFLVAMGAEVIKIEPPDGMGDVSRGVGPHHHPNLEKSASSFFYQSLNAGKKSLTLDLKQVEGMNIFHQLCKNSHAVINNLRGDVPDRLGLNYEQIKKFNPAIVCAHLSGYGRDGERLSWPGYDYLMQAETGVFSLTGEPESLPARMGLSMIDYMTGVIISLGVVAALHHAKATGVGCDVDVSLFDVALHNLNYVGAWMLNANAETKREPRSAHPSLTPCQLFKTQDGWIFLMCNKEKFWQQLCRKIDRLDLLESEKYRDYPARLKNRAELTIELDGTLIKKDTHEWMAHFAGTVPAAPVLSVAQALDSDYVKAKDLIQQYAIDGGNALRLIRNPLKTSLGKPILHPAPSLGADTRQILHELGLDASDLNTLHRKGVI